MSLVGIDATMIADLEDSLNACPLPLVLTVYLAGKTNQTKVDNQNSKQSNPDHKSTLQKKCVKLKSRL